MGEVRTGEDGTEMVFQPRDARSEGGSAKSIVEAERRTREEKTARLKAARLEKEAEATG